MRLSESVFVVASGSAGFGITNDYDCTVFLVKTSSGFLLIDAGAGIDTGAVIKNIEQAGFSVTDCKGILLTHAHADHIGGAKMLAEKSGASVYAWKESADYLSNGKWDKIALKAAVEAGIYPADYKIEPCDVTPVPEHGPLRLDGVLVETIPTAGHCSGHCCYYMELDGRKTLFAGDCVFLGGKISLQGIWDCSVTDYMESIRRLGELPVDALLPSHYGVVMGGGDRHIQAAYRIVQTLGVPKNAGYFA